MAEEAISTAILTVATIIAALVLINAMYPSLYSASGSILSMSGRASDRIRTDLTVLTVWYPPDRQGDIALEAWVKNTGSTTITGKDLNNTDLFLYTGNAMSVRIPDDSWTHTFMNGDGDANWDPAETLHVVVHYDPAGSTPGTWRLRIALPDGIYAEESFTYAD